MSKNSTLLSTIGQVPASYFVYSSFSFFGRRSGGELPGGWFVRAMTAAGREEAVIRQTLYRMEHDGELLTRRVGRMKFYSPSAYARAEITAGTEKIFEPPVRDWDGQWTLVHLTLRGAAMEKHHERVVALLAVEGFVQVDANLFAHPHPAAARLLESLPAAARSGVLIIRGSLTNEVSEKSLVALWQLDALATRYARVGRKLEQLDTRLKTGKSLTPRDAFITRFAVVFEYLGVAWEDPYLPLALLPATWEGDHVRKLASRLYERLLPGALRYADELLEEVLGGRPHLTAAGNA